MENSTQSPHLPLVEDQGANHEHDPGVGSHRRGGGKGEGRNRAQKFRPDLGETSSYVRSSRSGAAFPGKEQGPKSQGGKSSQRGVAEGTVQALGPVALKLFFHQRWGLEGSRPWRGSGRQARLCRAPSVCLQAAWRTWYLGQQPGAQHPLKDVALFLPPSHRAINYFDDLTGTDEGHFNYITRDRSPEAMSCWRSRWQSICIVGEREKLANLHGDCAGLPVVGQTTCEMHERAYLSDPKAVFCCNLASFFLSPFMQLHKKMIREDCSLGGCKNRDPQEEPSGRLPAGDTTTLHPPLGAKSAAPRRAGW